MMTNTAKISEKTTKKKKGTGVYSWVYMYLYWVLSQEKHHVPSLIHTQINTHLSHKHRKYPSDLTRREKHSGQLSTSPQPLWQCDNTNCVCERVRFRERAGEFACCSMSCDGTTAGYPVRSIVCLCICFQCPAELTGRFWEAICFQTEGRRIVLMSYSTDVSTLWYLRNLQNDDEVYSYSTTDNKLFIFALC